MRFSTSRSSRPPPSVLIAHHRTARVSRAALGMKSEDKLVTLCGHKAVAPSWQDFFLDKRVMHEATAFFIYCEKFQAKRPNPARASQRPNASRVP